MAKLPAGPGWATAVGPGTAPAELAVRGVGAGLLHAWRCSSNALPGTTIRALPSCPLKPGVCASWLSARRPQQKTRRKSVSYACSYLLLSNGVVVGLLHLPNMHGGLKESNTWI